MVRINAYSIKDTLGRHFLHSYPTGWTHGEGNGTPLQYSCHVKSHGWRSLVGCSPWGRSESDTTEWLHFHFSLSRIGEGNGNPFQCSCLENPRDRGAWWAAVYGVTQSRTRLKRLGSSSSRLDTYLIRKSKEHNLLSTALCMPQKYTWCRYFSCFYITYTMSIIFSIYRWRNWNTMANDLV